MTRLVEHAEKSPVQVDTTGEPIFVCRCGLTRNEKGLCDGSHQKAQDEKEGKLYCYDKQLNRKEIKGDEVKQCGCA
ncbi:MAG TPA: CDGSH iron-sulfur domain-containing protein [Candidatus Nealsonbacteria bacterium]|uniref:Iron-binding zinc finger CDGSH type domain-containing protein n=1 Tax=marine sediment metagenome TaxID=412755 RepID=A0A0F9UPC9_9ZZZZ|nr:CDGSH iron-sulfur domain-containing protein [Candidatus Nealsonbacteria bacterium]HEB46721.1 CDGSH iron-sulfur domain-containing protein [Candidatus Nealsonbacteria bacterium]